MTKGWKNLTFYAKTHIFYALTNVFRARKI